MPHGNPADSIRRHLLAKLSGAQRETLMTVCELLRT
jgi:hypothetical protein